jgi:hypothetical protein
LNNIQAPFLIERKNSFTANLRIFCLTHIRIKKTDFGF